MTNDRCCAWGASGSRAMREYHDTEWGVPTIDDPLRPVSPGPRSSGDVRDTGKPSRGLIRRLSLLSVRQMSIACFSTRASSGTG